MALFLRIPSKRETIGYLSLRRGVLEGLTSAKLRYVASRNLNRLLGLRVQAGARLTVLAKEAAETRKRDLLVVRQGVGDQASVVITVQFATEQGVEHATSVLLRKVGLFGQTTGERVLIHSCHNFLLLGLPVNVSPSGTRD